MPVTVKFRQEATGPLWAFHQLVLLPTPILRLLFFPLGGVESLHFHTVLPEHRDSLLLSSKVAGYEAGSCRTQLCLEESGRVLRMVQRWEVSIYSHICRPSVLPAVSWGFLLCFIRTTKLTCLCHQSPTLPTCPVLLPTRHPSGTRCYWVMDTREVHLRWEMFQNIFWTNSLLRKTLGVDIQPWYRGVLH